MLTSTLPHRPDGQNFYQSQPRAGRPWQRMVLVLLVLLMSGLAGSRAYALQGSLGAHDPSTIVKEGNKYWVFATGNGIHNMYSTDLINWTVSPRAVFPNNSWPAWINTKVPGFAGTFWAPECVFMNNKYYLYYSCSTFGSRVSTIGLATNVTLDPTNPSYQWIDEGEVISTTNASAVNAIDPSVFRDASNNMWFAYGSFFGGIRITQMNATTGKLMAANRFPVANGDVEAAYVEMHGGYYYLFVNRGACCQGANSTYYMVVGRSTFPTGPFLDQNGVDLNNFGGTVVMNASGRYIGPGHAGVLHENGASFLTHHYYDGEDNGAAKLGIANLTWDAAGWPVVSRDWITPGRYEIANQNSNLIWDAWGCTGAAGQMIAQGNRAGLNCQQWDFTALGNGEYKITNMLGGLAASVAGCSGANGAILELGAYTGASCQKFRIDRANDGTYVFASSNGNRVVEVPAASTTAGQHLALQDYGTCTCQRWTLATSALAVAPRQQLSGVSLYPVPAARNGFQVELESPAKAAATVVEVLTLHGQRVHQQEFRAQETHLAIEAPLQPGMYLVQIRQGNAFAVKKITVL